MSVKKNRLASDAFFEGYRGAMRTIEATLVDVERRSKHPDYLAIRERLQGELAGWIDARNALVKKVAAEQTRRQGAGS